MKIAGGQSENGVVFGNSYDKYGSRNPIVKWMMRGFGKALSGFVEDAAPRSIHDAGCGEGFWTLDWAARGLHVKGTDVSAQAIEIARANAAQRGLSPELFEVRSIYELDAGRDRADLVVCCEVLEHVEDPERALRSLQNVVGRDLILSVPREPLWRALNMVRGAYISDFGNTPGHVNHWSTGAIRTLAERYFDVTALATPLPWTMLHCKPR
jgi:2-polyprenyl-3-methyl-5-hydroxy-6-metoxy-1,4-benzoquinol methylase